MQDAIEAQLRRQDRLRRIVVWPGKGPEAKRPEFKVPGEMSEARRERLRDLLWEAVPHAVARRDVTLLLKLVRDDDLPWPTARVEGGLMPRKDLKATYLYAKEPGAFLDEATRRTGATNASARKRPGRRRGGRCRERPRGRRD